MDEFSEGEPVCVTPPKKCHWLSLFGAAVLSAVGGLLFGYDTGVISGAMIQLRQEFALSNFFQELIVSITLASAAVAALVSAGLNDWLGRKPVIISASLIFTAGAVVLGIAYSRTVLLIGRLIVGLGIGMASMTVPIYIAEISPVRLRGALVTLSTVSITAGQMIAAIVDGIFMSDEKNGWRYMLALGGVPSFIQFFGFLAMPETPRWLVQRGRFDEAKQVLIRIYGVTDATPEIHAELEKMIMASTVQPFSSEQPSISESNSDDGTHVAETNLGSGSPDDLPLTSSGSGRSIFERLTFIRMIRYRPTRRALVIGCSLQLFQQLVGINTVMYYSASIISMAGVGSGSGDQNKDSTVVWMAAVVASANFLFCVGSPWLISRLRRRTLLILSLVGVLLSLLVLGASFQLIASTSKSVTMFEPVPIGSVSSECLKAKTCDSCVRSLSCGFCYNIDHGDIVNASCLPALEKFSKVSSYGRCSNESVAQKNGAIWAFDHCPTPYGWITIVGLILYLASFAPGMASLPWTINSELYPTWARSTGVACSTGINWLSNIVVSLSFLSLTEAITKQGTYFMYAGVTALAIAFVYCCVPETGNVSLDETARTTTENG